MGTCPHNPIPTREADYAHHITASFKVFYSKTFSRFKKTKDPLDLNYYADNTSVAAFGGREEPFYMRGDMLRAISSLLPLLFFADSLSTPLTHINF